VCVCFDVIQSVLIHRPSQSLLARGVRMQVSTCVSVCVCVCVCEGVCVGVCLCVCVCVRV